MDAQCTSARRGDVLAGERTSPLTFWDFFWLMIWGFLFLTYLMVLFHVIVDVFRDRSLNGWARTGWLVALFIAPPLTGLIYLLVRGRGMGERSMQAAAETRAADEQARRFAGGSDPADAISKGKTLLDEGTISAAEFARLKGKALS
jgi:hypothetical protein